MKFIKVSILILLVAVQSFSKWLILLDYQVNQQIITQTLCENRDQPELKCKGKCQLIKKLAAEEAQNNNRDGALAKLKLAEVVCPLTGLQPSASTFSDSTSEHYGIYLIKAYTAPHPAPFHPPALA